MNQQQPKTPYWWKRAGRGLRAEGDLTPWTEAEKAEALRGLARWDARLDQSRRKWKHQTVGQVKAKRAPA